MGRKKLNLKCTIPDCGRRHTARGLCDTHYHRLSRYGRIETLTGELTVYQVKETKNNE